MHGGVEIIFLYFIGSELDQGPEQPVMEAERNNSLDNVGPHDSDLTDCADLYTDNKRSRKRKTEPEKWQKNVKKKTLKNAGKSYQTLKGRTILLKTKTSIHVLLFVD